MIATNFAPLYIDVNGPSPDPTVIFNDTSLSYLKENFGKWCEMGLVEVGVSRDLEKRAIRYIQPEFPGLIDAAYCLAMAMGDGRRMRKCLREYVANYYKKEVDHVNIIKPPDFCGLFFKEITQQSARSILWLMAEVVILNTDK